jgi:hypothetical protein
VVKSRCASSRGTGRILRPSFVLADAIVATCRYGQALGRELGEPAGHYEETNSAGWDLVDDTWAAALELFGR